MSTVYSREYLLNFPEERKQQHLNNIINSFQHEVVNAAAANRTSVMLDMVRFRQNGHTNPPQPVFTDEELVAAIEKRYPGCIVKIDEVWQDTGVNTRTFKKGIVIGRRVG